MSEFTENQTVYAKALRGTYIIFPLKYKQKLDILNMTVSDAVERNFRSLDWSDLLVQKCKREQGFVKRFVLEKQVESIQFDEKKTVIEIPVVEVELFVFENGIAMLSMLLVYENAKTPYIYEFINPGYVNDQKEGLRKKVIYLVKSIRINGKENILSLYVGAEDMAVKEAYLFNVALVTQRFNNLETLRKTSFNAHKLIDLSREFEDLSETDIAYTYGARDVEKCTYRWGACIASQSISYVYSVEDEVRWRDRIQLIHDTTEDDLLLTILVLYQKNTCMLLNEKIQTTINRGMKRKFFKQIMQLKREALLFRASGTLAPSQISRWNNICETYRILMEVNGVNETLTEIEEKIDLIKDEQERQASEMQNYIATVIAVFGLISIVAAVLQIVDLIQTGNTGLVIAFYSSCIGVILIVVSWLKMLWRKN